MSSITLDRRATLASASALALAIMSGRVSADNAPLAPWQWTDQNGLLRDLPKDKAPLKDELAKYPRCRYCGMERAKFSHSRHLIVYDDDSVDGTCSLHCAAIGLSLNMDLGPKAIWVGDAGASESPKPLVLVDKAFYVIDPSRPGTMTKTSNFAYADKAKADAAAAAEASARAGAKVVGFDEALRGAYLVMADDTIRLRKMRGEARAKAKN